MQQNTVLTTFPVIWPQFLNFSTYRQFFSTESIFKLKSNLFLEKNYRFDKIRTLCFFCASILFFWSCVSSNHSSFLTLIHSESLSLFCDSLTSGSSPRPPHLLTHSFLKFIHPSLRLTLASFITVPPVVLSSFRDHFSAFASSLHHSPFRRHFAIASPLFRHHFAAVFSIWWVFFSLFLNPTGKEKEGLREDKKRRRAERGMEEGEERRRIEKKRSLGLKKLKNVKKRSRR